MGTETFEPKSNKICKMHNVKRKRSTKRIKEQNGQRKDENVNVFKEQNEQLKEKKD